MRLLYKTGPMESLRKWFYKPKRDDRSLLAQFFFADDALNMVAAELDSFDGRKDPDRCSTLVNQLRHAQDRVLNITSQIMDQLLGDGRVARGFRVKFPEDVLQDNLAGQLWFGAECLAAGSSIMNREEESAAMRPLAKALTRSLETVRSLLREQCLRPRGLALSHHDDMLHESLRIFDKLFAEFELYYVSAMVNVKTPHEFEAQQLICVLFSESLRRALKQGLLTQEQVDAYDPALMFAVPRLAIVSGLLIYSSGPLSIDKLPEEMSDMFRPFRTLLHKIRSLLWTLDRRELAALERLLCSNEDVSSVAATRCNTEEPTDDQYPDIGEFVSRFYADHVHCRELYTQQSSTDQTVSDGDYLPDNMEVLTPILDGKRRLSVDDADAPPHCGVTAPQDDPADTFHEPKDFLAVRKTSRNEGNDLGALRNLSTNGLMMFDPLVMSVSATSESRQLPDADLVTSLNEQVTEIADRLSSIVTSDSEALEHSMHSYSTNDVPTLISTDCDGEAFGFSGPRNEQLSCLPSTSHGYLIPNAISQEPVVLASLSHNNSAVFNPEDEATDMNGSIVGELPMIIPDSTIDAEIVNTNICIANANLSSLLLTNGEYRHNFLETHEEDNTSFHSAKSLDKEEEERVKFMLGYESDTQESPADSGVSTENTSLDRSPDSDPNRDINKEHFMTQNRVLAPERTEDRQKTEYVLESSFSDVQTRIDDDVTVNITYAEDSEAQDKNEAGTSSHIIDSVNIDKETRDSSIKPEEPAASGEVKTEAVEDNITIDEVITELRRYSEEERLTLPPAHVDQRTVRVDIDTSSSSSRPKKVRKAGSKSKRKRSKMWSPGIVILDNRATLNQSSPLRLNLDHFVDTSSTSGPISMSECADDEQIALALQAQELAARQQARGKFKSSEDLIHRLFVCIAGVADQLQTNFAADLRNILKAVFLMNQTPDEPVEPETPESTENTESTVEAEGKAETIEYEPTEDQVIQNHSSFDSVYSAEEVYADSNSSHSSNSDRAHLARRNTVNSTTLAEQATTSRKCVEVNLQSSVSTGDLSGGERQRATPAPVPGVERAPDWVPDIAAPACMRCAAHFTAFRRRHHCRNCGKVFCASCSSNSIPLPRYGQLKPVRVCEECFANIATNCRRTQR